MIFHIMKSKRNHYFTNKELQQKLSSRSAGNDGIENP